ncbi:CID domain-containing protein [Entamoeba marina]
MNNIDELLVNKLHQITKHSPTVPHSLIQEICNLCFKSKNPKNVVFRIEEFIRNSWPTYKHVALHIIDLICDEKVSPNHELTLQFRSKLRFRLLDIIIQILVCRDSQKTKVLAFLKKWSNLGVFSSPLCEECTSIVQDSLYNDNRMNSNIIDVDNDIPVKEHSTFMPTYEHSITRDDKYKRDSCSNRSHGYDQQNHFDSGPFRDTRSYYHDNSYDELNHRIRNDGPNSRRYNSSSRRRERSSSRRRCSTHHYEHYNSSPRPYERKQQRYYQEDDRLSPRNYRQEPRSNNGEYSKSFHEYDHYDKYDDGKNEQIFRKNSYSNSDRSCFEGDNFDDRYQSYCDDEPLHIKSHSENDTLFTTQTNRCLDTKKSLMEELDEGDNHNNKQKAVLELFPDKSPDGGEILLKTNAVIVCSIPSEWKTSNDVFKEMGDIRVNQMRLIPEHKCLYISFKNHQDALQMKTNKIGKCDVVWGKEQWMRDYRLRNDGIVSIPIKNIPQYIRYNSNGTYEVV